MKQILKIEEHTDNELVNLILRGEDKNETLFKELYKRNSKWVYNKAIQIVGEADAADVTQDIFVKTYMNLSKFKQDSKFSTWLFSIAYRMCLDFYQKKKKTYEFSSKYREYIDNDNEIMHWEDDKVERELMTVKIDKLSEILDEIEPIEKTVLLMKYQDDMKIKDIMKVLNLSEGATKMKLRRAKDKVLVIYKKEK